MERNIERNLGRDSCFLRGIERNIYLKVFEVFFFLKLSASINTQQLLSGAYKGNKRVYKTYLEKFPKCMG